MALCALEGRTVISASGGQTVFTIGWDATLINDADVLLWLEDVSAGTPGAEVVQGAGAGKFTVDRVAGTCTLGTAAEVGDIITIERHQSTPVRKTTFSQPGDFIPSTVNNEFDHFLQLIGDLSRDRCRSIRMDRGVSLTSLDLELPAPVAGSAIGWTDATTIGNIGVLLTGSGTLNTIPLWTPNGFTLGDSVMTQSSTLITIAGTLTVNSNAEGTTILGRAKIGTVAGQANTTTFAHFGHFDQNSYALEQNSIGDTRLNAPSGRFAQIAIADNGELVVSGTLVEIPSDDFQVTLGDVDIPAGALTVWGLVTAGTGSTVLTTAAGLLRHQAIDPAIAGAGITNTSGVLSVTSGLAGSGTNGTIPLWTPDGDTLGDSVLTQVATVIAVAGTFIVRGNATEVTQSVAGTVTNLTVTQSDNTNASSNAVVNVNSGGASGGDPIVSWQVSAVQTYTLGIDNSDSDKFVGSVGATHGTSNWLEVTTAGAILLTGVVSAGSGPTTITTAAGLLRHQAIDPAIAGTGLGVSTGVLSVDNAAALVTLSDNSMADTLHRHSELSASDGTPDANFSLDATGNATLTTGDLTLSVGGLEVTAGMLGVGVTPLVDLHVFGLTDPRMRLDYSGAGLTALTVDMPGLELLAGGMNPTNKFTSALKFMSRDSSFTTENPKLLGAIAGRATETYGADTGGGMALDFFSTPNAPGATSIPVLALTLEQNTDVIVPTGNFGVGTTPLTDVHIDMNAAATLDSLTGSVFLQAFDNAGAGNLGAGIIFGDASGSTLSGSGASIVGYQPTASASTVGLSFYTHDSTGGGPRTLAMQLDSDQAAIFAGDRIFSGADKGVLGGTMYIDGGSIEVVNAGIDVFVEIPATWTTGKTNGVTFQNDKELKILTAGWYSFVWSAAFIPDNILDSYEGAILLNGTKQDNGSDHTAAPLAGNPTSMGGSGWVDCAVDDIISVGMANHVNATRDCDVEHASLKLEQVMGT